MKHTDLMQQQIQREHDGVQAGVDAYYQQVNYLANTKQGASTGPASRLISHWFTPLKVMCEKELDRALSKTLKVADRDMAGTRLGMQILATCPVENIVSAALTAALNYVLRAVREDEYTGMFKRVSICNEIGRAVIGEANHCILKSGEFSEDVEILVRRMKVRLPAKFTAIAQLKMGDDAFASHHQTIIGAQFMRYMIMVCSAANYNQPFEPAFKKVTKTNCTTRRTRQETFITISNKAIRLIDEGHELRSLTRPCTKPMIVPPINWTNTGDGGFIKIRRAVVCKNKLLHRKAAEASDTVYLDAINHMQHTAWRINKFTLDTMTSMWDARSSLAGLPSHDDMEWDSTDLTSLPKGVVHRILTYNEQVRRHNAKLTSHRVRFSNTIDIAVELQDRKRFYFPHYIDWRGRFYAGCRFNHQEGDITRGVLEFANGVTPDMDEVKLQLSAACAADKYTRDTRIKWVDDNMGAFEGWAQDPLNHTGWMSEDYDNWQALAAARALFDEDAAAHLPVTVDGSCNGMQHYAALARSHEDGQHVNLVPSSQPQDIYKHIAQMTTARCEDELEGEVFVTVKDQPYRIDKRVLGIIDRTRREIGKKFWMKI